MSFNNILASNYPVNTVIRTGAIEYNTPDENITEIFKQVTSFIHDKEDVNFISQDIKTVW